MNTYVVLFRGINVGGKNIIPMAELKLLLQKSNFENVLTYIQSGNVILQSSLNEIEVRKKIENLVPNHFKLDDLLIKVLVLSNTDYEEIVKKAPKNFGSTPEEFRYNVLFTIDVNSQEIAQEIKLRDGVDNIWVGEKVIYFRNSIAEASKSSLSKIIQKPFYKSITIRNWNTTRKLLALIQ